MNTISQLENWIMCIWKEIMMLIYFGDVLQYLWAAIQSLTN